MEKNKEYGGFRSLRPGLPRLQEAVACLCALAVWLAVTALFIGFRPEHIFLAVLIGVLFSSLPHPVASLWR